jgi:pyridinium-3,5-bisthiocarboxylic acid mononucleotide nickel chelatase
VGAVDSIADIVGTAIALDELGVARVEASPVPTGCGFVQIAHGRVAVPAPATAELLKGIPLAYSDIPHELTTPTGAAVLKATACRFGPVPAMRIQNIGYGAGTRDLEGQANVLRVLIGETEEPAPAFRVEVDQVLVLETNIDNTTPEELAACINRLWDSGALDVYQTPCLMKKGRSGVQVTVLCAPSRAAELEGILFTHGGTIGIRRSLADRRKLIRRELTVTTIAGPIRGKCVWLPTGGWRFSAELEDVNAVALANQWTIAAVRSLADSEFQSMQPLPPP